jgi:hypothetical protein
MLKSMFSILGILFRKITLYPIQQFTGILNTVCHAAIKLF